MKSFLRILSILFFCFFGGQKVYAAPPPNDDCSNATNIPISVAGFGLGVFTSPTSILTDATIQFGEPFYSSLITAGNDKKSVWYKFTLVTNRGVNIELKQPGTLIALNAAGFTLYKSNTCLPALGDIPPAKLTPLPQFGSSYNPCLNAGEYYLQVSSRLASNGPIFVDMTLTTPGVLNDHDLKSTRHNFGTISNGWFDHTYDVGCQTIDNATETCSALGVNAPDYAQSTWLTFTTDAYVDLVRLEMGEINNSSGGHRVGYNIYQGDCFTNPNGLALVDGCNVTQQTGFNYVGSRDYWTGKNYTCFFLPNTTYTIQIFYNKGYINTVGVRLYEFGVAPTDAPIPTALGTAPGNTNALGALPSNGAGITTSGTDYLGCNAKLINNACGTVNPATGIVNSVAAAGDWKLDTWYTFTITNSSNVHIYTPPNLLKRFYTGNVFGNCNLTSPIEFTTSDYAINCMAPGTYSIQLLGKVDTTGRNVFDYYANQLSAPANLSVNVQRLQSLNRFSLTDATLALGNARVDRFNAFAPLVNGVTTYGAPDTLGCLNTVLPDGNTPYCGGPNTKAIYRKLTVGANGILTLGGGNYYFQYILYRGDAQVLANGQNVFATGQTITGLQDLTGCQDLYWSYPRVCVTPGVYTLVSFGDQSDVGYRDEPWVQFNPAVTLFPNPASPNNLGTLTTASFPASGTTDTWSCIDNPLTIAGEAPCSGATKQIYREFFLATPQYLNIYNSGYAFRWFAGRVSNGTADPNIPGYGNLGCIGSFNADVNACTPRIIPAGWYSIVIYAGGGIYTGPNFINGSIGATTNLTMSLSAPPVIPAPIYNRPYKAYVANGGLPIVWGPNTGTAAIPETARTYTFGTEQFNCQNDLPFSARPITGCNPTDNRLAYFVFTLTQESYVNFSGIPTSLTSKIFRLNARTADSLLFPTATPIQGCINTGYLYWDNWYWNGDIEICRMQPGTYTLVVYANDSHINTSFTPLAYIEKVESSRFDHANKAYDFGNMPGDNVVRSGKIADVNPLNAGRTPSNDFFTCTTGAQPSDPANFCWDGAYQNGATNATVPYPMPINTPHYTGSATPPIRRNLWYTFTVTGPGIVTVNVNNLTPNRLTQYPYSIYKSNVNGLTPFPTVVSNGDVDSTFLQGLTLVATTANPNLGGNSNFSYYCYSNDAQRSFVRDECLGIVTDRYYIIVDHHSHLELNSQVDVNIKFVSTPVQPILYDHYSQANLINGLNQVNPAYTPVTLNNGTYTGSTGYFSCATNDVPDPASCDPKSLWYKIVVGATGRIRINYTTTSGGVNTTSYDNNNIQLYRQLIPGDSTATGMFQVPLGTVYDVGMYWGEACMNPGTYYILLTGCNYTIETVIPRVMLIQQSGDFCADPVAFSVVDAGTANASVDVTCHTMEPDYGEDGSNMGCLFGPGGYKSTWYKVTVNSAQKMDVSFQLSEFTNSFPNQIRYRVLFGSCGAMTAGPCNTDALTQFTLNCMPIGITDYYVQIVTPINTTGNINLAVTTTVSPDQLCVPVNPTIPVANFTVGPACDGETVQFSNQSTLGATVTYLWDFGCCAGATSSALSPSFTFPTTNAVTTYNVSLLVTNTALATTNTTTIPVTIYPQPVCNISIASPFNVGATPAGVPLSFLSGAANTIGAPPTSYLWDFGNGQTSTISNPTGIQFNSFGTFNVTLTITNGTCARTCTMTVVTVPAAIYGGGINDGTSQSTDVACIVVNIFAGGENDGAGQSSQFACIISNIFAGGINDGAATSTAAGCTILNIFAGSENDGAGASTAVGCIVANLYAGGINDGAGLAIAVGCVVANIFAGGPYDGANANLYSGCFTANIYAGGAFDGAGRGIQFRDPLNCALIALPIELSKFAVKCLQTETSTNKGYISWTTESESNNAYFTIERSDNNGLDWVSVGNVSGAINSVQALNYYLIDDKIIRGEIFYRLTQTDLNGVQKTAQPIALQNCADTEGGINVYPNPTSGAVNIEIASASDEVEVRELVIYSYLGQVVARHSFSVTKGINNFMIDLNDQVTGMYTFLFNKSDGTNSSQMKVVKL